MTRSLQSLSVRMMSYRSSPIDSRPVIPVNPNTDQWGPGCSGTLFTGSCLTTENHLGEVDDRTLVPGVALQLHHIHRLPADDR